MFVHTMRLCDPTKNIGGDDVVTVYNTSAWLFDTDAYIYQMMIKRGVFCSMSATG